jgi:hypothetical protein
LEVGVECGEEWERAKTRLGVVGDLEGTRGFEVGVVGGAGDCWGWGVRRETREGPGEVIFEGDFTVLKIDFFGVIWAAGSNFPAVFSSLTRFVGDSIPTAFRSVVLNLAFPSSNPLRFNTFSCLNAVFAVEPTIPFASSSSSSSSVKSQTERLLSGFAAVEADLSLLADASLEDLRLYVTT